jgi:hypothetical protein
VKSRRNGLRAAILALAAEVVTETASSKSQAVPTSDLPGVTRIGQYRRRECKGSVANEPAPDLIAPADDTRLNHIAVAHTNDPVRRSAPR